MRWKTIAVIGLVVALVMAWGQKSAPVTPAQPDREIYGLLDLALFENYQEPADYQRAFGVAAPAFNPAYRPKAWFDSTVDASDPEADVCYLVARLVNAQPRAVQACMPAWEARVVNIATGEARSGQNDPRARPPRDCPIRALFANEALVYETPFGIRVMRLDLREKRLNAEPGFRPSDRALLEAIGRKLGVQ